MIAQPPNEDTFVVDGSRSRGGSGDRSRSRCTRAAVDAVARNRMIQGTGNGRTFSNLF